MADLMLTVLVETRLFGVLTLLLPTMLPLPSRLVPERWIVSKCAFSLVGLVVFWTALSLPFFVPLMRHLF